MRANLALESQSQYVMFIAQTAYIDLLMFQLATAQNEQVRVPWARESISLSNNRC